MTVTRYTLGSLAIAATLAAVPGCGRREQAATLPPPEVAVSQPVEQEVQESLEFTGRTAAVESVEVRARVQGYIVKVAFTDGQLVEQGDLLFQIDPRDYQNAVLRSEGEIARLKAMLARTESEVVRTQRLRPSGAASEREVEKAIAEKGATEGELKAAQAQLEQARLDLEFTQVRAPIAGRASRAEITTGNLVVVGAGGGPLLTTLVSVDPVYVYFDVDERASLRFRKATIERSGRANPESVRDAKIAVGVALADEEGFPHGGIIDFVDNQVDPSTGTMKARAVVKNDGQLLSPGLFVRVRLPFGAPGRGVLITDRAVGTDQDRKYVLIVNDQNVVEYRPVKLGPIVDGLRAVHEGLAPGDWVIVNGIQRARPGLTVKPNRVAMRPAPAASATPAGS